MSGDTKAVILAVDDERMNLDLLEALLIPRGYTVLKAATGEEALEMIPRDRPDMVLLDIMMPGMDGYEVCRKIKGDPEIAYLPVVMLTSLGSKEDKIRGLEAGAEDFLTKPFQKVELVTRIKNLLKVKTLYDEVEKKNQVISGILNRYVDSNVVDQILEDPLEHLKLGGVKKNVAVMFADIRGFTSMSEKMDAGDVIAMLNCIFQKLTGVVFQFEGTLDKFIGDCLMAFWGAPLAVEEATFKAVRAALEMQYAFGMIKRAWPPERQNVGIGIGINYGEVVVGNIGAENAMDYTVIGDVVNTAERIESKAGPGVVLLSESAMEQVSGLFEIEERDPVSLKGKAEPVEIYQVLGLA